ncbi:MAG: sugar phosphate isomerase/epimerase family protein [Spirochaetales bacterium]
MREVAVSVNLKNVGVTPLHTMQAIKSAGFKNIFISWKDYVDKNGKITTKEQQLEIAKGLGLNVIFVHLICDRMFEVWDEGAEEAFNNKLEIFKRDIDACKNSGVKLAIMHINGGWETEAHINKTGLLRLGEMLKYATKNGIRIAMENANSIPGGYLESAIETFKDDMIGICYDSGHAHCNKYGKTFNFEPFKNRIFAVHLHDNHGNLQNAPDGKDRDEHLIPFDGNIDWQNIMDNLNTSNYVAPITLELHYKEPYLNLTIEEFYKKVFAVATRLSKLAQ